MIETEFKQFVTAALRIGATMLESADDSQLAQIDGAIRSGARLSLELFPLPAFERLELVLVEREGARHRVASMTVNKRLQ